ncbi:MAG TPA: efflux RND transporter periplasmic adaptor subunit [Bacteroidia bacterium]|jgi:RND family efflux transporter MFP subunit|nr:efflux RND transporter periplasmic adaptor subunit [Bacteroidia bacterium]
MKKSFVIIAALSFFAVSCGQKSKEDQLKDKKSQFEALRKEITELEMEIAKDKGDSTAVGKSVAVTTINYSTFDHYIDIQGRIDADESVTVSPTMPGLVKTVNVQAGDVVSAGQVLASIDADVYVQQLSALKVQRDLAKDVYDRQTKLHDQQIGTELQYMQAKGNYESLDKQVSALQEQIDLSFLKAPMAGVVDNVGLKVGEIAAAGFNSITIVNTTKLRVKGDVAEAYIAKVKKGCPVKIEIPDADQTIDATITYSGQIVNKLNRTFGVEVVLPAGQKNILPNMVAVLKINDFTQDSSLVIPTSAIQTTTDGKTFVFVASTSKDGRVVAQKREVTYSHDYNGMTKIETGLLAGDRVITEGYTDLNDGDPILVK